MHLYLALASALVCAVVVVQDVIVPVLRQKSISAGLTGPYHWFLDGAFLLLAGALATSFRYPAPAIQSALATGSAASLLLTGASGTWTDTLDKYTNGKGEKIHAACTAVTFSLALALQVVTNHNPYMWGMTCMSVAAAGVTHFLVANASVTEKVGVLGLCSWLIAGAL